MITSNNSKTIIETFKERDILFLDNSLFKIVLSPKQFLNISFTSHNLVFQPN